MFAVGCSERGEWMNDIPVLENVHPTGPAQFREPIPPPPGYLSPWSTEMVWGMGPDATLWDDQVGS